MIKILISNGLCLLICLFALQGCKVRKLFDPIRIPEGKNPDSSKLYPPYRKDEIIVIYKSTPGFLKTQTIKSAISDRVDTNLLNIRRCNNCDGYAELWSAPNITTVIHGEGVRAGTVGGGSKGVGDDSLAYYSLNYINYLPYENTDAAPFQKKENMPLVSGSGKDTIIVAVLDTGIDTADYIHSEYLWKNPGEDDTGKDKDGDCYASDVSGWNFAYNTPNLTDDQHDQHGTLISQYIINEFERSPVNFVQLMVLKTHRSDGTGDLFSSICAIHYAIKKGANIINASWGFYYYDDQPPHYMDSLISEILPRKGILFITAAGNKIPSDDLKAQEIYRNAHGGMNIPDVLLRDLYYHNFYPACLSKNPKNSVITATTTNEIVISPTQNFSSGYVDLAVKADLVTTDRMKFQSPFVAGTRGYISGSSYATAIVSGKIGAFFSKSGYVPGISKVTVLGNLLSRSSGLLYLKPDLERHGFVRRGIVTKPVH